MQIIQDIMTSYLGIEIVAHLVRTVIQIAIAIVLQRSANFFVHRVLDNVQNRKHIHGHSFNNARFDTLQQVLHNIISVVIWGIVFVMVLAEWGMNITPIITGAGVLGLAIGFGSQTLVKDMVSGFFILLENQFNIGDKIEISGTRGFVVDINLRTTILKGSDESVHIIPNSQITRVSKNLPEVQPDTDA
ncbi:hypothetical protein COX05_03425 [candidate division WWE3 bacterium CG22_combo_CG10-13_8_21_14_all_39_12]|uniref:Mechanosensitive ion channel protein MscS n=2 Tax=Katanobacteria TaxID=422282 RepID=A0A2M7X3C4_UNCKA|nr:MAG: hypothetical protein COX05_03425 [candidate division WWE3 bacterium CG22_combo_CG10-13_8_21_14_all_39_12]PJA40663.1 MAG: hypothetical protein CO179_01670 [candidate division WWE3 bacterium CG_4_9_14_3_um_filter_39_7]